MATLASDFNTIAKAKSVSRQLLKLQNEQIARNFKAISATTTRNFGDLRELVAGKVLPLVTKRVKGNFELLRKVA